LAISSGRPTTWFLEFKYNFIAKGGSLKKEKEGRNYGERGR